MVIGAIAVLIIVAFLMLLLYNSSRKRTPEEVMERMGRFATREELLAVTDSSGHKHAPNAVAVSLEKMMEGGSAAERAASLLMRADVQLTIGEYFVLRVLGAVGGAA